MSKPKCGAFHEPDNVNEIDEWDEIDDCQRYCHVIFECGHCAWLWMPCDEDSRPYIPWKD